jgi:hypothetical protein
LFKDEKSRAAIFHMAHKHAAGRRRFTFLPPFKETGLARAL